MLAPPILSRYPPLAYPAGRVPGFDPTHPAAEGCAFSGIAASGGGFINVLNGNPGTQGGSPSAVIDGNIGRASLYSGSNDNSNFVVPILSITSCSIAAILRIVSISGNNAFIIGNNSTTLVYVASTGVVDIFGIGNSVTASSGIALSAGVPYFVAGSVVNGSGNPASFVVVNLKTGQILTASATATATSLGSGSPLYIGNRNTLNRPPDASIAAAMISYNNYLPLPTLLQWAQRPWDFWYPISKANGMGIFG